MELTNLQWLAISNYIYELEYEPLIENGFADSLIEYIESEMVDDYINDNPIYYDENLFKMTAHDEIDRYIPLTELKHHLKIIYEKMGYYVGV